MRRAAHGPVGEPAARAACASTACPLRRRCPAPAKPSDGGGRAGQRLRQNGCSAAYAATVAAKAAPRAHAQVVTELAYGGEVFDHLLVNGPCTEDEARSVMRQLVGSPC